MTQEEMEQVKEYEWDKFSRRFPTTVDQGFVARMLLLFRYKGNTQKLLWENGFLSGVKWAYEQQMKGGK